MSKLEIKNAAMVLFNQRGYEGASIRDITAAAHLSPSTFYSHYPSKEELYFEIMEECFAALTETVKETLACQANAPVDEQLFHIVETRVNFFFVQHEYYLFLVRNSIFPPAPLKARVETRVNEWELNFFHEVGLIIDEGKRLKIFSDAPTEEMARSLLRLIAGYGVQIITQQQSLEESRTSLVDAWGIYIAGLLRR